MNDVEIIRGAIRHAEDKVQRSSERVRTLEFRRDENAAEKMRHVVFIQQSRRDALKRMLVLYEIVSEGKAVLAKANCPKHFRLTPEDV